MNNRKKAQRGRVSIFLTALLLAGTFALTGCSQTKSADDEKKDAKTEEKKEVTKKAWDSTYPEIEIETELECNDFWQLVVDDITEKYSTDRKGEVIFYGASNFSLWSSLDDDMAAYKVQNHGFGGSIDVELVGYADQLLFPYEPSIVFFQTGSNDYVKLEGTDQEKIEKCMAYKKQMFEAFHKQLPDAKFVIMSGLLLPGRAEYLELTLEINRQLEQLAEETDYLYYVDANAMTYDGTDFDRSLFVEDGIHLNHEGQMRWYNEYIQPMMERVISENGLESVRNN